MSARPARASSGSGRRSGPTTTPAKPLRRSQRLSGAELRSPEPGDGPQESPGALEAKSRALKKLAAPSPKATPANPGHKEIVLRKIVPRAAQTPKGRTPSAKSPKITFFLEKENRSPIPEPTWESLFKPCSGPSTPDSLPAPLPPGPNSASNVDLDLRDLEMSKKVRRSYSRPGTPRNTNLAATSTPTASRPSCFGFEGLLSTEELTTVSPVVCPKTTTEASEASAVPWLPDTALPGISPPMAAREKRKKKKVLGVLKSELDEWAAAMNAEFAAAEQFDLLIE